MIAERSHAAADQDRLAGRPEGVWQFPCRGQSAGSSLAMNEQAPSRPEISCLSSLQVLCDTSKRRQSRFGEEMAEDASGEMGDDLAIGQRAIDAGSHGAEIALPSSDRIGAQASSRSGSASPGRGGDRHFAQELGPDLMAEAARAAVDAQNQVAEVQSEAARRRLVMDGRNLLQLEIVIAGAERAHFRVLPFAASETASGFAPAMVPRSSMRSRSAALP